MAVSSSPEPWSVLSRFSWWSDIQGGVVGTLSVLAVILTLGLLAFSPLGASAVAVGLAATFVTTVIGGVVYAAVGRAAMPTAGPSSATALILASLVLELTVGTRNGPTTNVSLVVAGCAAAVAMSGVLQILLARLGLARLARLVPRPVLAGFMNGVALLILLGQLPLLLGQLPGAPLTWQTLMGWQPGAAVLALGSVIFILLLQRHAPRWPAALLALVLGSVACMAWQAVSPTSSLGPTVGVATLKWPDLLPFDNWTRAADQRVLLDHGLSIALTGVLLALIGSLESIMNLLAQDQEAGTRHDPQRELVALGLCNMVCGALGGLPVVMLRARAMAIVQAGGRGRLAALAGSLALAVLWMVGWPLLALLPLSVLGGIMVTVAFGLVDRWTGQLLLRWWRGEDSAELRSGLLVMALVCGMTLWQGFAAGVALGVLLSMVIFISRMNRSLLRTRLTADDLPSRRIYPPPQETRLKAIRHQIQVWELEGALFFGNADRLVALGDKLPPEVRALVLDLRRVTSVDETGAAALTTLDSHLKQRSMLVLVAGLAKDSAPERALRAFSQNLLRQPDADRAIEAAEQHLLGPLGESTLTARPLGESGLLQGLTAEQVEQVSACLVEQRLFAGETLFRQGDPADGLYLLSLGSISVIARGGESTQRFLSISPGMMLGETAMLDGGGRSADAVADSFAVVHHLSQENLKALEQSHPAVASRLHANIATYLSTRLRAASAAWWASQN